MKTLFIHQIYGLYDDNKSIYDNPLFMESFAWYKLICDRNNKNLNRNYEYVYILWDKEMCEKLIEIYPEFNYYHNVRHKIMKVDIIRFLILYHYGGFYSDLDVIPKIENFDFLYEAINYDKLFVGHYYWTPQEDGKKIIMDMEVIGTGMEKNKILYDYLKYIPSQIEEKNNMEIYNSWKIRYVFQTTGPPSFRRFLKPTMRFDQVRHLTMCGIKKGISFKDKYNKEEYGNIDYQFLSYFSLSYKEQLHGDKNVEYKKKK